MANRVRLANGWDESAIPRPRMRGCGIRYADDFVIYVNSKRAGERVMESVTRFVTRKLRLKVNAASRGAAETACPPGRRDRRERQQLGGPPVEQQVPRVQLHHFAGESADSASLENDQALQEEGQGTDPPHLRS